MANKKTKNDKSSTSLWSLIGGEGFAVLIRQHLGLIGFIVILVIFYIDNRYTVQRQQLQIDKLKKELVKDKYINLTRSSQLMEISRQSRIEEYVQKTNSDLQTSTEPPYLIINKSKK